MTSIRILRTRDAAVYIGLAASTLEKKRLTGAGPAFVRLGGRAVGYDIRVLDAWLERQQRTSTSDESRSSFDGGRRRSTHDQA
jgi:predicted DNA-binding transcriptional regulator AlpA